MSNKRYRKEPEGNWVVMLVLPLDAGRHNIRLRRVRTREEARLLLSKILRGFLLDRRNSDKDMLLNRVHLTSKEDTHVYFLSGQAFLPVFLMTKSEREFPGPISLLVDRMGGNDAVSNAAAPFIAAWIRAMATVEAKRGKDTYKVVRRK